jgi:hypothetical protein
MSGWERRPPAELQMGNGSLLVTFDSVGEIEQLFAPHPDSLQAKVGAYRTLLIIAREREGAWHAAELVPVSAEHFEACLTLERGSQVLRVEHRHRAAGYRLRRTIALHPAEPVLLDRWEIDPPTSEERLSLMHQTVPWMGYSTSGFCSLYHPTFNGLVHHRGRRWFGVLARQRVEWVRVGYLPGHERSRLWDGERIFAPVGPQDLGRYPAHGARGGWDQVVQGTGVFGAMAGGDVARDAAAPVAVEFVVLCGESERHLEQLLNGVRHVEAPRFLRMIETQVARRHAPAATFLERVSDPRVRALCERSIDVLHALQDARTGALMAAAEVDPHCRSSGGYGYSWPRDGAYLAAGLGQFGFRERVEHYFRFLQETQDPSGTWWQRYTATGHAGPSWGRIQIDEPATVIRAAYEHYRRTQDLFWLEKTWPMIERGLGFLEQFHGPDHALGLPSHDLWEERMGIHAYSLGAVAAAFRAGARLADELHREPQARHYDEWAEALKGLISEKFVPDSGPIRRAFLVHDWDYLRAGGYWDETPDVSLIGLVRPFRVYSKDEPRGRRLLDVVRGNLWNMEVGGILRYTGDHYRGGNPWILTTLWVGALELAMGDLAAARTRLDWVHAKATPLGMLAEQVHRETGRPSWVIPLGWSHAMYLLFVREALDRGAERSLWGG